MGEIAQDKFFFDGLTQSTLWPLILRFNADMQSDELIGEDLAFTNLVPWLRSLPDSARLGRENSPPNFFWDFTENSRKLALLDSEATIQLAHIVGVSVNANSLAKLVLRKDREQAISVLGENLFKYALMRGQYQVGSVANFFVSKNTDIPLSNRCFWHGWGILATLGKNWPKQLEETFLSRIHPLAQSDAVDLDAASFTVSNDVSSQLWTLVKRCLVREVSPAWAQYFTS